MTDASTINSTNSEAISSALAAILQQSPDPDSYKLDSRHWLFTDSSGTRHIYSWEEEITSASLEEQEIPQEGTDSELQLPTISTSVTTQILKSVPYGKNLLKSWQRDPVTGEEMETKEDHTLTVTRPDGTRIVQFGDGTRITSLNAHSHPSFIIESTGYARVEMTADGRSVITLTSHVEVHMDRTGSYKVKDDDVILKFKPGGHTLIDDRLGTLQLNLNDINSTNEDIMNYSHNNKDDIMYGINREFNLYSSSTISNIANESNDNTCMKPRIFALKQDGSGWELLHTSSTPKIIESWKNRGDVVYNTQQLNGSDGAMLHSAVVPIITAEPEVGYLHYLDGNIIPQNLRSQYYFPLELTRHTPSKLKDKPFGSGLGKGLDINLKTLSSTENKSTLPRAFWRRQIIEDKPIPYDIQRQVVRAVNKLNELRDQEETEAESFLPLQWASESCRKQSDSLYYKYMSLMAETDHHVISHYVEATRALIPPIPPKALSERRKVKAIENAKEMADFEENLTALRSKDVPGYFQSPQGLNFLENQKILKEKTRAPDLDELTQKLPIAMRTIQEVESEMDHSDNIRQKEDTSTTLVSSSPAATLDTTYTILAEDKTLGSETSVMVNGADRPFNPSPHSSRIISADNTPTSVMTINIIHQHKTTEEENKNTAEQNCIPDYLFYNVAGIPRTTPVKLPKSIKVSSFEIHRVAQ